MFTYKYICLQRHIVTCIIFQVISKLDIFPLMCATNKVRITELTLIHKNIRSVHNSHISQSEVKHIMRLTDKNNNISFEGIDRHYHSASGLATILVIMSVSTFKTVAILYIYILYYNVPSCCLMTFCRISIALFSTFGRYIIAYFPSIFLMCGLTFASNNIIMILILAILLTSESLVIVWRAVFPLSSNKF